MTGECDPDEVCTGIADEACPADSFEPVGTACGNPGDGICDLQEIAMANGLHYVYTGNVRDSEGGSTYCPQCKQRVIERDWYQLGDWQLVNKNQCRFCHTAIAGVFADQPGSWGARRLPVRILQA